MSFGPTKIQIQDVLLLTLSSCISGLIGSLSIMLVIFIAGNILSIQDTNSGITFLFPFVLSFITLLGSGGSIFLYHVFAQLIEPNRYQLRRIQALHIGFFACITYLLFTPLYLTFGKENTEQMLFVFIAHTLFLTFGSTLIQELLSQYKYILASLYASLISLFLTCSFLFFALSYISLGKVLLLSLTLLLPIIMGGMTFWNQFFHFLYYKYYCWTNLDVLGDIFSKIEYEYEEQKREELQKNTI